MKTLIIAEKPSVATDIARVLGGMKKTGDYYEGEQYVVANALGHLLELACPEKYEVKRGKWTFAHLPVLPPTFDLKPIAKSGEKLKSLARLIRRKDIGEIINACDAGREGELIFRYIMQATKAKQPIKRLWLQSMTPAAIREAFAHLRTDEEMQTLAAAAKSRSEADWLVGINGTRGSRLSFPFLRAPMKAAGLIPCLRRTPPSPNCGPNVFLTVRLLKKSSAAARARRPR